MNELSLNVLDIAQNSVKAQATLIEISVNADTAADLLTIVIRDNGKGMSSEQLERVCDPFFTTRTTRRVGLGIPFSKLAAESAGGDFSIESQEGKGTSVTASFVISNIDRMPLGDMCATIHALVTMNTSIDFVYTLRVDSREFVLDTRQMREILGGISFDAPEVSAFIMDFLRENTAQTVLDTAL